MNRNLHRAHFPPTALTPLLPAPALNEGECKVSGGKLKVSLQVDPPRNSRAPRLKLKLDFLGSRARKRHVAGEAPARRPLLASVINWDRPLYPRLSVPSPLLLSRCRSPHKLCTKIQNTYDVSKTTTGQHRECGIYAFPR